MIKGEASMKQNIVHVGLDVDDTQYHGSALTKTPGSHCLQIPTNIVACAREMVGFVWESLGKVAA